MMNFLKPVFFLFLSIQIAWAAPELPLVDLSKLSQPAVQESVFRIRTARVAWANYELIREDFSFLRTKSNTGIDLWLEANTVISAGQANQTLFNSKVETAEFAGTAVRPKEYGRALVIDTGHGLLDQKGAGSKSPSLKWVDGDPRTGNVTLGESLREALYSEAVALALKDAKSDVSVVRTYAVMDNGFDVHHVNSKGEIVGKSPAGSLFRQGHTRFENPGAIELADQGKYFLWDQERSLQVEKILRQYGLTSVGAGRGAGDVEGGINIQGTKGQSVLDFGNYVTASQFEHVPVTHFYGTRPLLTPGGDFPQPDPHKSLPVELWGPYRAGEIGSKLDKPWVWSHEAAQTVADMNRRGDLKGAREVVDRHFEAMLGPFKRKLAQRILPGHEGLLEAAKTIEKTHVKCLHLR